MTLLSKKLQELPAAQRIPRMRHYLKVPFYAARFMRSRPTTLVAAFDLAKEEAELKMNLLQDWADHYPKG